MQVDNNNKKELNDDIKKIMIENQESFRYDTLYVWSLYPF